VTPLQVELLVQKAILKIFIKKENCLLRKERKDLVLRVKLKRYNSPVCSARKKDLKDYLEGKENEFI